MNKYITIILVLLLASCATHRYVSVNKSNQNKTGEIIINFSDRIDGLSVFLDDSLIVQKDLNKAITIQNVSPGSHKVRIESSGLKNPGVEKVNIKANEKIEIYKEVKNQGGLTYLPALGGALLGLLIFAII